MIGIVFEQAEGTITSPAEQATNRIGKMVVVYREVSEFAGIPMPSSIPSFRPTTNRASSTLDGQEAFVLIHCEAKSILHVKATHVFWAPLITPRAMICLHFLAVFQKPGALACPNTVTIFSNPVTLILLVVFFGPTCLAWQVLPHLNDSYATC